MKRIKTKNSLLLFLSFMFAVLCYAPFYVSKNREVSKVLADAPEQPVIELRYNPAVQTSNDEVHSIEKTAKSVTFYVFSDRDVPQDVFVRVKTMNMSAVAGVNYTQADKTVVIKRGTHSSSTTIEIKSPSNFEVDRVLNQFKIKIYDIESNNATISTSRSELTIAIKANSEYRTTNGYFYEYYNNIYEIDAPSDIKITDSNLHTYSVSSNNWLSREIKSGLMTLYATGTTTLDEHWYETDNTPIYITLYDGSSSSTKLYSQGYYNLTTEKIYFGTDVDRADGKDEYINKEGYNSFKSNGFENRQVYYFKIESGTIFITIKQAVSLDRWANNWTFDWVVRDINAPKITGYYVDKNIVVKNEPVRISVRFSEPVTINHSSKPSISATLTGTQAYKNKVVTFNYAGGEGTDTLYFDYIPTEVGTISNISINGIINSTGIGDYGRNTSDKHNYCPDLSTDANMRAYNCRPIDLKSDLTCTFDNMYPTLDFESSTVDTYAKSHAVTILTSSGEFKNIGYEWSQNIDLSNDEIHFYTKNKSFTTVNDTGTGTYYLHLLSQSYYSPETFTRKVVGPFYFDNSAPEIEFLEDSIGSGSHEKEIKFNLHDDTDIQAVIMYYSEEQPPFSSSATLNKTLIYGNLTNESWAQGVNVIDSEQMTSTYQNGQFSFTIDPKNLLSFDTEKGYGDYYIGFQAVDALGNVTDVEFLDSLVSFDIRNSFETELKINNKPAEEDSIFEVDGSYVVDISNGIDRLTFTRYGNSTEFGIHSFVKIDGYSRVDIAVADYFDNYELNHSTSSASISFDVREVGYYEIVFYVINEGEKTYSNINRFYVTDGNTTSNTNNYSNIYNGRGLNYKTGVYMLGNGRYFYRTSTGMGTLATAYYNNSPQPLVFSSKLKAVEYVKTMELLDIYAIRLTLNDVISLKNGSLLIASGEDRIPEVDQVWVRYKSPTWNYSSSQKDWGYYYYGNSLEIDPENFSANLKMSIEGVINLIVNKGQNVWLTELDGLNENGVPYLDSIRVPNSETFTQTKNGSSINITYEFDSEIFSDHIAGNNINIITWHNFTFKTATKIFYAPFDVNLDYTDCQSYVGLFQRLIGNNLTELVENGTYVIRELDDNGLRDYLVYIDKVEPTITIQYTSLSGEQFNNDVLDKSKDGLIIHTKEFAIREFVDNVDDYSHIDIYDVEKEKTLFKSFDLTSFHDENIYNGRYNFPYGVYEIQVYDRAGNHFTIYVSVAKSEFDFNLVSIKDDKLILSLNDRIVEDIVEFKVTLNGNVIVDNFANSCEKIGYSYGIIFYEAGLYEIEATDAYGYTINQVVELVRVNPHENIVWMTRNGDNYEALDETAISDFAKDIYYISSDEKLTFILDSLDIYSFEFGGNVKYEVSEQDNKIFVDTTSVERWSVKIYYTRFPEISVTYNRVGLNIAPPAAINIKTDVGYMDSDKIVQPNDQNKIVLYVYTETEITSDIKVTLKTRNKSAISELGDYEEYYNTVILTPEKREARIVIQTYPSGISTFDEKTGKYNTRLFEVMIVDVEGNGKVGDDGIVECAVQGENELAIDTKNNIKYFKEYLNGYKQNIAGVSLDTLADSTDEKDKNRYYDEDRYYSVNTSWYSAFVETGLARLYTTVGFTLEGNSDSIESDIIFKLLDRYDNSNLFSVVLNNIEDENKVMLGSTYGSAKVVLASESYDKNTSIRLSSARGNAPSGRYYIIDSNSVGNMKFNIHENSYSYYVPGDEYSSGYYVYALSKRYLTQIFGYSIVVDNSAPTISGYYLDHETIKQNDILRLSIRFSEPVYINGALPYISARISGTATVIKFDYAGGAGTDTLYFEFNPELYGSEINISSIMIQSISNESSICDFAYNTSDKNNKLGTVTPPSATDFDFSCSVDSRTPTIDSSYVVPDRIVKSVSVPVTVSKINTGGVIEYAWTTDEETPSIYTNSLDILTNNQNFYIQNDGLSGIYYLHIRASSVYGKTTLKKFGPFYFDAMPAVIKDLEIEEASKSLKERVISFNIKDYPLGSASSGIDKIYMTYSTYGQDDFVTKTIYDSNAEVNVFSIDINGKVSFLLHYYDLGLGKEEQRDYTIGFFATDKLSNTISFTNYTFYNGYVKFDSRSTIDVEVNPVEDYEIFSVNGTSVYDSSYGVSLKFEFSRYADEYDIHEFLVNDELISKANYENYFTYIKESDGLLVNIVPNMAGYLTFKLKATSGEIENQSTQYTDSFNFYFTVGVNSAQTNNYVAIQNGTLLVNKVYYLGDTKYYYHDNSGIKTLNYNDTTLLQAFSSKQKAYDYVYYNELKDLYAFIIPTSAVATSLNNGDGSYRKAQEDTNRVAEVGQVWIRYKRATWDGSTSTDAWVYYYYGMSSELITSALPASLQTALMQVSNTIVAKGRFAYLTSYEGLDNNNSPILNEKQIHTQGETINFTLCGSTFRSPVTFEADYDIYNSMVKPAGYEECSIITSYKFDFNKFTNLYYAKDYGRIATVSEYIQLPKNYTFANVNIESGVYWIREIDENGMRDFRAYIDKTAPSLNISYTNSKGDNNLIKVDSSVDGLVINGRALSINGFGSEEVDTMAYVAVFKKSGALYAVYRSEDFVNGKIDIPEGQYYFEICDRSGNMYQVIVRLNTTAMVCRVVGEENRYMRVICNRDTVDIALYEIYLDGEIIESNYSPNLIFYGAGLYTIRIEDWYGNVFTYEYELKRALPSIDWSFEQGDVFVSYDGTQNCVSFSKNSDTEYVITTNRKLQFAYQSSSDYDFEFTDKDLSYTKTDFNGKTRVKINTESNWTVKIYYVKHPNVYVVYKCIVDKTAPTISVEARQEIMTMFDEKQVSDANDGLTENSDDIFTPNSIRFGLNKVLIRNVNINSTIFANLINASFVDNSICTSVKVYLDGKLIIDKTNGLGVEDITLSRFGYYQIVATDMLGNEGVFSFRNIKPSSFTFMVDDREVDIKQNPLDYFSDANGNELTYPIDTYGNSYMLVGFNGNSDVAFLIEKDGNTKYIRFEYSNGVISKVVYKLSRFEDTQTGEYTYAYQKISERVLDVTTLELSANIEENRFRIADHSDALLNIYVQVDLDKNVLFYVEAPKDAEAVVEARCVFDVNYQPYYLKTILSGQKPSVSITTIKSGGEEKQVEENNSSNIIYLSGTFFVNRNNLEENNISKIQIAYSTTTDFDNYQTIYENREYTKVEFSQEGFYSIIIENLYGTTSIYTAILSNTLNVVLKTTSSDEKVYQYSTNYDQLVKTNGLVEIFIYASSANIDLTKDGEQSSSLISSVDGYCTLSYSQSGTYEITITDTFGNVVSYRFEIGSQEIEFDSDYLYGFNEKALKKDDDYTNKKLSFDKQLLLENDIKFVSIKYGETETIIYDLIAENETIIVNERLLEAVGNMGDGIYTITIRNSFGDKQTRVIHYRQTPTLSVSRLIRTSNTPQQLEFVEGANKLYSNYSITFTTISSQFEVRVNNLRVDLPLSLIFPSDKDDVGEYVQNVTYIDEYGFDYSFEVNLIRNKYDVNFATITKVIEIDGTKYTKDKVSLEFSEGANCTYTLNGGEPQEYLSNQILSKDGTYRFYITDIAGNISTATIKKDTMAEYIFTYAGSDRKVENGSVINSGRVQFSPVNKDSVKLKTILLNGEPYTNVSATGFSEMGQWEFLIEDNVGNTSYFSFYIITHSLASFEYETPYTFKIAEITLDNGDGIPVSYMNSVKQYDNYSQISFVESGNYMVRATSNATSAVLTFSITIDKTPPKATLVGAEEGKTTTENVSLQDCEIGDVIEIYKDGELTKTVHIVSSSTEVPEITEKGQYRVVITNKAGNTVEYNFTRQYTANVATTIFTLSVLAILAVGLFVGLVSRKRLKV